VTEKLPSEHIPEEFQQATLDNDIQTPDNTITTDKLRNHVPKGLYTIKAKPTLIKISL